MKKLVSIFFLFILSNSCSHAQGDQVNIDSLKRVQKEKRELTQARKREVDEAIKRIELSGLTDKEINRKMSPVLKKYKAKDYRELLSKYDSLLLNEQSLLDSIDLQLVKIDSLQQAANKAISAKTNADSLMQDIQRLKSIMKNYVAEINLVQTNTRAKIDSADVYYYDLDDHKKPKIYFYSCPQNPDRSQYWKVTSNPKDSSLITEAFSDDFIQFERFEEKFDSLGSKLVDYRMIDKDAITSTMVEKNVVYLWQSDNMYSYRVKYDSPYGKIQFSKSRMFLRSDTLLVLGNMKEVIVFSEKYDFYNITSNNSFKYTQFSYYAKGIGFVKYERSVPINSTDYEFINLELDSILSQKEWKKLIKRRGSNDHSKKKNHNK